jgi:hypothetical protein
VRLLGPTEIACRFMGPLGTAISCLLIYYLGRRLFDPIAGLWAMMIYSVGLLPSMIGTAATADAAVMPLNLGVLALAASALWGDNGVKWGHFIGMAVLFGLAMLAKSPFGLLPLVAIGGMGVINRFSGRPLRLTWRFTLLCTLAAAIGFAMFLAWFLPANAATDGQFFARHVGRHIVERATSPLEHHGGGGLEYVAMLPYYAVVIVAAFFPWTLYLPGAISGLLGGRIGGGRAKVFLLGWIGATFLLMSLTVTKLPHYILIVMPALALAVAGAIRAERSGLLEVRDLAWLKRGRWFFVPVAGMLLAAVIAVFAAILLGSESAKLMVEYLPKIAWKPTFQILTALSFPLAVVGVIVLGMGYLVRREQTGDKKISVPTHLVIYMVVLQLVVSVAVIPVFERQKISPALAQAVRAATDENVPVYWYDYEEPSFIFYVHRHAEKLNSEEAVADWAKTGGPGVLVICRPTLEKLLAAGQMPELPVIGEKAGLNYSKGTFLDVVALRRK